MKDEDIIKKIDELSNEMISEIKSIVRIKSVEDTPTKDAPFGSGIRKALDHTLKLCERLGFKAHDIDHYMGYASYGRGNDYICAIGHLDIVPEGVGWSHDPYSGYEEDGVIYSRGILDNKGPIYACLYALYALKLLNFKPRHEIRIIFGCNEETGFNDLKYYLEKEKPPIAGFTPDCKYPVVYAERGRLNVKVKTGASERMIQFLNTYILNSKNLGERFNIEYQNDEFGKLELRNYHIDNDTEMRFSVSYPSGITMDEIMNNLNELNYSFEVISNYDPVFFDKEAPMIKVMQESYEKVTGNDGSPVTTTGGTYAKLMPNIVPFGPSFPGQKGIGHNPNEWMTIEDLITNAKIYALTLMRLGEMENL